MDSFGNSTYSPEDDQNLPEYAQSVLPELNDGDLPTLVLTSHGHLPPLNPPPDLRIDVRSLSNPPKHIRDAYDGNSKRLQEWIKEDPVFIAMRDAIRTDIKAAMTAKMDEHEKKDVLKLEPKDGQKDPKTQPLRSDKESRLNKIDEVDDVESEEDESEDSTSTDEEDGSADHGMKLRVGIFCAMGRHRSVAMTEELSKMAWPGWQVKVEHRDLSKKRGKGKRSEGRDTKSRGTRGGSSSYNYEDA